MSDEVPQSIPNVSPTTSPAVIEVTSVTGQKIRLLHQSEKTYYEEAKKKYLAEYTFTQANDMRLVDRLLNLEVQCQRYQWYTLAGIDYDANLIVAKEESDYRRAIKELNQQILDVQKELGVTKAERERATDKDSVGAYITELLQRAKEFGLMREKQLDRGLELVNELFAMTGAYKRSNENERRKLGLEDPETIIDWVIEVMQPSYNEIDDHFKQGDGTPGSGQKYWIRTI